MVTVKEFIPIVSYVIDPCICYVHEEYEDTNEDTNEDTGFEKYHKLITFNGCEHLQCLKNLRPYSDYEVLKFEQTYNFGELDSQILWIRKIQKRGK